jgi:phosphate/sulfate permease
MLLSLAFALGALFGWRRAAARGGDRLDRLQYAAVHGILFALVTLIVTIGAERFGLI